MARIEGCMRSADGRAARKCNDSILRCAERRLRRDGASAPKALAHFYHHHAPSATERRDAATRYFRAKPRRSGDSVR